MKKTALSLLALAIAGFAGIALADSPRPLAPDDIYALKTVGDPRLSPDGRFVAYTVRELQRKEDGSDTDVYMVPLAPNAMPRPQLPSISSASMRTEVGRRVGACSLREGRATAASSKIAASAAQDSRFVYPAFRLSLGMVPRTTNPKILRILEKIFLDGIICAFLGLIRADQPNLRSSAGYCASRLPADVRGYDGFSLIERVSFYSRVWLRLDCSLIIHARVP